MCPEPSVPSCEPLWEPLAEQGNAIFVLCCQVCAEQYPRCGDPYNDSRCPIEKPCYIPEMLVVKRNVTDCGTGFYPLRGDRTFPSGKTNFSS